MYLRTEGPAVQYNCSFGGELLRAVHRCDIHRNLLIWDNSVNFRNVNQLFAHSLSSISNVDIILSDLDQFLLLPVLTHVGVAVMMR